MRHFEGGRKAVEIVVLGRQKTHTAVILHRVEKLAWIQNLSADAQWVVSALLVLLVVVLVVKVKFFTDAGEQHILPKETVLVF